MRVTILGSGTSIPHPDRASPGLAIELPEGVALVDPSPGSIHRMVAHGISFPALRWVLFTHFHPDHTGDLVPILFAMCNPVEAVPEQIQLRGPVGLGELVARLEGVYGSWIRPGEGRVQLQEIGEGTWSFPGWELEAHRVEHTDTSLGFRITDSHGRVLMYSGDSDDCPALVELARDADLAIVECAQPMGKKMPGHLTPDAVGRIAAEANVRRLVLTHMYPACDGHDLLADVKNAGFEGRAELAADGLAIEP